MSSSRPRTPNENRRSSRRHSLRSSFHQPGVHYPVDSDTLPLETLFLVNKFASLLDSIAELESNMTRFSQLQYSTSSFNESFSAFLYGLSVSAWCFHFPGCPSLRKWEEQHEDREVNNRIRDLEERIKLAKVKNLVLKSKATTVSLLATLEKPPNRLGKNLFDVNRGRVTKRSNFR